MMASENRNKKAFPRCGVETRQTTLAGFYCSVPQPARTAKKRACRSQCFTAHAIRRLTGHASPLNLQSICSTKLKVFAVKFEMRRWPVSRGLVRGVEA